MLPLQNSRRLTERLVCICSCSPEPSGGNGGKRSVAMEFLSNRSGNSHTATGRTTEGSKTTTGSAQHNQLELILLDERGIADSRDL